MANKSNHHRKYHALEKLKCFHVNKSGLSDYLKRKYKDNSPGTGIIETIETESGIDIRVRATACHYGGFRYWAVCDGCDNNKLVLREIRTEKHNGLYCNGCLNGVHKVTQLSKADRRLKRRTKIRARLGLPRQQGLRHLMNEFDKPKGMHWRTFYPLMWRYNHLLEKDINLWIAASIRAFPHMADVLRR